MNYEVSQVVGEGEEEDEEEKTVIEKSPEEDLIQALENYKNSEIAQLHLFTHNLIQDQKNSMKLSEIQLVNYSKIDEYLKKVKNLSKRKKVLEHKANNIKNRLEKAMVALKSKKE